MYSSSNLRYFKSKIADTGIRIFAFVGRYELVPCVMFYKVIDLFIRRSKECGETVENLTVSFLARFTVMPHRVSRNFSKTGKSSI